MSDHIFFMVDRFLGWKLPHDFVPDAGITFQPIFNQGTPYEMRHEPTGTNLLNASQTRAMLEFVAEPVLTHMKELEAVPARMKPFLHHREDCHEKLALLRWNAGDRDNPLCTCGLTALMQP